MSMWETPARGDDTPQATLTSTASAAAGDTCPTCGGTRAGQDRPLRDLRRGGMGQASR